MLVAAAACTSAFTVFAVPSSAVGASPAHTDSAVADDVVCKGAATHDNIEKACGIPKTNQEKFRKWVNEAKHRYTIDIRPGNPDSVPWLKSGKALPKPEFLKAKTINSYDVQLGMKKAFVGTVGFFSPKDPGKGAPEKLKKRFAQRKEEYDQLKAKMAELVKNNKIKIHEGVVCGTYSGGKKVNNPDPCGNPKNTYKWAPFTGDHDIFDIKDAKGEKRLATQAAYDNAVASLKQGNMAVMHGAHMYWKPQPGFEKKMCNDIVNRHRPSGGEMLVRYAPDKKPALVFYTSTETVCPVKLPWETTRTSRPNSVLPPRLNWEQWDQAPLAGLRSGT
ncbi:hypothetical protein CP973_39695 [Streptomyces albofaciens JCM 4342]|nr:hypothetical protein CP973_39695 [Streptomyces albofaciens JCM 4342]